MFEPMLLSEAAPSITMPTVQDWSPVVKAVTDNFTTSNIIGVLAAVVGTGIVFVFLWWAVRLAFRSIMGAVKGGTLSINSGKKRRKG